jgi:hypothetical protein
MKALHYASTEDASQRHPERSEGSVAMGSEMLRCAQHDRAVTQTNAWINLLICLIAPLLLLSHRGR